MMSRVFRFLIAPLLCAMVLGGIVLEQRRHVTPKDLEGYHARVAAEIEAIPARIGHYWIGKDQPVPTPAIKLLKPNAIISRIYIDTQPGEGGLQRRAALLMVQTRESRDMQGHYPANCYVSSGMTKTRDIRREWVVDGLAIHGTEYEFQQRLENQLTRMVVYNFLMVPGRTGIVADIKPVYQASEDYQQRYFGAAQVQVVFNDLMASELTQAERDEIFKELVQPCVPAIRTILAGGIHSP